MTDIEQLRGSLAGSYAVERELGRGGMATVYLAEDLKHHRQVAIKVLRPELAAGLGAERFLREIETAARLHHPHILALHDSGNADGFLYYVMPYVEGESLRDRLDREKQLPVDDALRITREVGEALQYAHDHDVLHRDIKPDNIMLESGHAMVADFGVARAVTEAGGETLTSTGLAVGTPTYMSPEQAAAEKGIDGRSDLYSLGCLLYEMLAGEPPHTGPTAQAIIARRLSEPAPSLRAVRESVPEVVHQALATALARAPADRQESVVEFVESLNKEASEGGRHSGAKRMVGILGIVVLMALGVFVVRDRFWTPAGQVPEVDPGIAVLPFSTSGPDAEYLGEGMVHLLSTNLDGLAGIRKIDPQAVLYHWNRLVADEDVPRPGAALDVARSVGARYFITGAVVTGGSDMTLTAQVHEVDGQESRGSVPVVGPADSISVLVDELTFELLRQEIVPAHGSQPLVNLSRATTTSLDALKAYLAGEQKFRQAHWDEAITDFITAIELDSTFARAMYRLSVAYGFTGQFPLSFEFSRRAAALADGLPERDSLLLVGHEILGPAGIAPLERLTSRYPDDVDGWYSLGETYFHFGGVALSSADGFREAFNNAVALSPHQGESYIHLIEDAFVRLDSARVKTLLDGYHALDPDNPACPGYGVIANLRWGVDADRAQAVAALDTMPYDALEGCAWVAIAGSQLALERAERSDLARKDIEDGINNRVGALFRMLQARTMRGQLAMAFQVLDQAAANPIVTVHAARFQMMYYLSGFQGSEAVDQAVAVMADSKRFDDHFWLGAMAAEEGRWGEVEQAISAIEVQAESLETNGSGQAVWAQAEADALQAYLGILRGEWQRQSEFEEAMLRLAPWGYNSESVAYYLRYKVGRLLFENGDLRGAERYFLSFNQFQWMYLVPSHYYLGRIYEALDRPEEAAVHYQLFVDWWRDADPELQDWWQEGLDGLARVTGEPREVSSE